VQSKGGIEGAEDTKGSGLVTKGGEAGPGGEGTVRGLEFILYTQQLQRRVQESWIVTEKKPGLLAAVSFKIQVDGEVQEVELMKRPAIARLISPCCVEIRSVSSSANLSENLLHRKLS
jgi:hypothetical protein